ncbi:MAG: squalene/phytoene synthase family protein [Pseudomonadales bacterium]|nr:squalene/phytoene synthase family protein [Pseudomonadales bacterium]
MIAAAREAFAAATPAGSARYFAWLYAHPKQRATLELLLALEYELESSVRPAIDHAVAHARLEWWEAEAERLLRGTAQHPIAQMLGSTRTTRPCPPIDLRAFIATLHWDLAGTPLTTSAEWQHYARSWSRAFFEPLVRLLVAGDADEAPVLETSRNSIENYAQRAGGALGIARSLRRSAPLTPEDGGSGTGDFERTALRSAALTDLRTAVATLAPTDQPRLRPTLVWLGCQYDAVSRNADVIPPSGWSLLRANFRAWRFARCATAQTFELSGAT